MAKEIIHPSYPTGSTLYFVVRSAAGHQYYNGAAMENFTSANWGTYDIAMTESGTSGKYSGNFPALDAGLYKIEIYKQVGGSPALTDYLIYEQDFPWDGTVEVRAFSGSEQANTFLKHNFSGMTGEPSRCLLNAARNLTNKEGVVGATRTVYKEDGTTPAIAYTITTDADAIPIVTSNPTT